MSEANKEHKDMNRYALAIGQIVVNLQILELLLRVRLYHEDSPRSVLPSEIEATLLRELSVGEEAILNSLTSYESFGELITRYNGQLPPTDADCKVDASVVRLRDALAHGRVSSESLSADNVLLKFSKPAGKTVRVEYAQQLSEKWLTDQIAWLSAEIKKIREATHRFQERQGVSTEG